MFDNGFSSMFDNDVGGGYVFYLFGFFCGVCEYWVWL